MREFITQNIALIIICAEIFGIICFIAAGIIKKRNTNKKIERCTGRVNGIVSRKYTSRESHYVEFKYIVDGVEYGGTYPINIDFSGVSLEKGQTVELQYNPNKPKEYIFKELDLHHVKSGRIVSFLGAAIFLLMLIITIIVSKAIGM